LLASLSLLAVGLLEVISGCFLVWSVLKIRNFLRWRGDDGNDINLQQVLLHSSAFALFLFSVVIYDATYAWTTIESYNSLSYDVFTCSEVIESFCSFVS